MSRQPLEIAADPELLLAERLLNPLWQANMLRPERLSEILAASVSPRQDRRRQTLAGQAARRELTPDETAELERLENQWFDWRWGEDVRQLATATGESMADAHRRKVMAIVDATRLYVANAEAKSESESYVRSPKSENGSRSNLSST